MSIGSGYGGRPKKVEPLELPCIISAMSRSEPRFSGFLGSRESRTSNEEYSSILDFGKQTLSSIAKVVLQKGSIVGLLIVFALLLNSWASGLSCLLGSVICTLTGRALKVDGTIHASGVLGLNGALTGAALVAFTSSNPAAATFPGLMLWFWIALAAATTAVMVSGFAALLRPTKLPILSFPFCAATWIFLASLQQFTGMAAAPHTNLAAGASGGPGWLTVFDGTVNGFAEIFFQQGIVSGLLIILAIALNSRTSAVLGFCACLLANTVGLLFGVASGAISSGAYGSNAVLSAIVLGGFVAPPEARRVAYALGGALLTAVAYGGAVTVFQGVGLPVLFLPFVAVTWLMVAASRPSRGLAPTVPQEMSGMAEELLIETGESALLPTVVKK